MSAAVNRAIRDGKASIALVIAALFAGAAIGWFAAGW